MRSSERTFRGLILWPVDLIRILVTIRKYDFIHCHYTSRLASLGIVAARLSRKPNTVTAHGRGTLDSSVRNSLPGKIYRMISLKFANGVIAPSEEIAQIASGWNDDVRYIPNGVDLMNFTMDVERTAPQFSFVTVRRLVPKNGVHFATTALIDFAVANPELEIYFDICGAGPLERSLKERILDTSAPNLNVRFLGDIPHIELPVIIKRSRYALFLSTAEAVSLALLECMACGVIPIVNPVGGLGEIVKHQENGLVLQYADKNHHAESNYEASTEIPAEMNEAISSILTAIITGDLTRGNLRAEARKTAEDYDWSRIFAKTVDYYYYLGA